LIVSTALGIPSLFLSDYEFSKSWIFIHPTWLMCPEVIPEAAFRCDRGRIVKYPGIKEDVYVPRFNPDPTIKAHLGLKGGELVVTLRPPANEAHYHNPQSDQLFDAVIELLDKKPNTKVILLPRNDKQTVSARKRWPDLFSAGKILIPECAVDGLNLMWYSDLVISGGGTMNREAAALGVPVYSIFRGKTGAVDQYLADTGRLVLLENVADVRTKIILAHRHPQARTENAGGAVLQHIVNTIVAILESGSPPASHESGNRVNPPKVVEYVNRRESDVPVVRRSP